MKVGRKIWVTFDRIGYHCYPDAPEDVSYLSHPHRHKFLFRVEIEVQHNERDIEYHQFKNQIMSWYDTGVCEFNNMSCEAIAEHLAYKVAAVFGHRQITVDVSEDGECGSTVTLGVGCEKH